MIDMKKSRLELNSVDKIVELRGIMPDGAVQKLIDREVLKRSEQLVPLDTGRTIKSGWDKTKIGSGEVVYKTPYVEDIYRNKRNYSGAPQRGSYWFERMKSASKDDILKMAANEAGGRGES